MNTKQPEALRLAEMLTADEWPGNVTLVSYARECVAELRRQHARITELESQLAQRFDAADMATAAPAQPAPENIRGILASCRDSIDTTKVPAYPAGADLANEIDALLAAQAVVPADLITIRKPTTSAEMLWLLKLAHLVISDVDKTLEAAFAPAQPAEASRFGSPELQAMIIARCVEKDQADNVQEDAARWHWLAEYLVGTRTDLDDEIVASETVNDLRKLVDADLATRKQGATQ